MYARRKNSFVFLAGGLLCLALAALLLHSFSGKFTDKAKDEEMPAMQDTINVSRKSMSVSGETTNSIASVKLDDGGPCVIYITGAVKKPGVYTVKSGSRVYMALEAAGGFSDAADQIAVNLAAPVSDAEHLHFPTKTETKNNHNTYVPAGITSAQNVQNNNVRTEGHSARKYYNGTLINLNSAGQGEFELLPGIGPKTAAAILGYRESSGGFKRIEDLLQVKGIGPKKYDAIKDMVTLGK